MKAPAEEPRTRPQLIHETAAENLRYIRSAMEHAATFTAVPGFGTIAVGATAVLASIAAGQDISSTRWLTAWLIEAFFAAAIGLVAIVLKARAAAIPLATAPTRRFALAFLPAMIAGGILTLVFWTNEMRPQIAPMWLLLYGTAVMAGGALSVRIVPVMGVAFAALGTLLFFLPVTAQPAVMTAGFGLLHVVFGALIARYHGG